MQKLLTSYLITVIALALADGVSGLITATAENFKTSINLSTAKKQIEINKLALQQEQGDCKAIGFAIPDYEEDDDEYDDKT